MGDKGRQIVKMNVEELIYWLNKAYADEWLVYYQYWVGAKVVKGPMKEAVIAELTEHAEMLTGRIIQLGAHPF